MKGQEYERIGALIGGDRPVILDGAVGTELPQVGRAANGAEDPLWGTRALIDTPDAVLDVHRRYVVTGCHVISTDTWGLAAAMAGDAPAAGAWDGHGAPTHWMDIARRGLRLARLAASERSGDEPCAVAFSLNGDIDSPPGRETVRLLARLFADEPEPPDLVLVETLSVLRDSLAERVEDLLAGGLPVWLSFRRCRHGPCGVYGQHWGGPEGDAFGRAARRFEEMGVGALLVNCIPPDHVDGIVSYLRDFTDLPLGVYPNLGYLTSQGWSFDPHVSGDEYARMALRWRAEGAQIIGGCCGVRPQHIAAARERLQGTAPGRQRVEPVPRNGDAAVQPWPVPDPWTDRRRRRLHPLPFPDLVTDPGVQPSDEASFMVWRHLFDEGIGARQRCLDVGCGAGLLTVQLALNGAAHVHAIDSDPRAVQNTLTNAFRNGVDGRVSAAAVDLYPWVPDERYEVVVASLPQTPVDPFAAAHTHGAGDYWGRHLVDRLIAKLPDALAPEGIAYLMHLSILSQQRTAALLDAAGFSAQVVDYTLHGFTPEQAASRSQISRVEELSDAQHLHVGDRDVVVAYLLEVRAKGDASSRPAAEGSAAGVPLP